MTLLHQAAQKAVEALRGLADEFVKVYPIYYYAEPWAHDRNEVLKNARAIIGVVESALQHQEVPREPVAHRGRSMTDRYEAMFLAAVQSLAEISKELDIADDEAATANGNELILDAIEARQQAIENLLAQIHRDGGHYIAMHGMEKAIADADAKIIAWLARDDAEALSASPSTTQQQEVQRCGSHECKAARQDGVICADGECDIAAGQRAAAPSTPENAGGGAACGACPDDRSTCKAECLLAAESPPVPAAEWLKCHRCGEPWNRGAEPFGHACSAQAGRFDDDWAPNPNDDQGTPGAPSPVSQTPPPLGTDGGTPQ